MDSVFLYGKKESEEKILVETINNEPEKLPQELLSKGVLVNQVIKIVHQFGKNTLHYVNPTTKEQWLKYVDRPLTQIEEIEVLKQQNAAMIFTLVENGLM